MRRRSSRSKYGNKKTKTRGEAFDSKAEGKYYRKLLEMQKQGIVKEIELQPRFELQPTFKKNGVTHRSIVYVADYRVTYSDGHIEIVDVKGAKTAIFIMKHKMFEYKYPDLQLIIEDV